MVLWGLTHNIQTQPAHCNIDVQYNDVNTQHANVTGPTYVLHVLECSANFHIYCSIIHNNHILQYKVYTDNSVHLQVLRLVFDCMYEIHLIVIQSHLKNIIPSYTGFGLHIGNE